MIRMWPLLGLLGCGGEVDPGTPVTAAELEVEPLSPADRLLRISMALRGIRPSVDAMRCVEDDPDCLERLVDDYVESEAFGLTIRDMIGELLQTRVDTSVQFPTMGDASGFQTEEIYASTTDAAPRLVEYIVMNDRPYSEIVTADFMLADPVLAAIYGVDYDPEGPTWQRSAWVDGRPMAGILSDSELYRRHVSNGSNFHRGRANFLAGALLCEDFASREIAVQGGIDLSDAFEVADAVRSDPACVGCHQAMDPLAGFFWGWQDRVLAFSIEKAHRFGCHWHPENPEDPPDRPEDWCYPLALYTPFEEEDWQLWDLRPPAYFSEPGAGVADLGAFMASDARFSTCAVRRFQSWFTQLPLDELPVDETLALHDDFLASGMNAKQLAKAVVLSESFAVARVVRGEADGIPPLQVIRPEAYARTVEDLTGFRWMADLSDESCPVPCQWGSVDLGITDRYGFRAMSGGIDGIQTTAPSHSATPTKALVMERMAYEAASTVVETDFAEPDRSRRKLLHLVDEGDVGEAEVREQLIGLYAQILGQSLAADDPDVDEAWLLFELGGWELVIGALLQDPRMVFY